MNTNERAEAKFWEKELNARISIMCEIQRGLGLSDPADGKKFFDTVNQTAADLNWDFGDFLREIASSFILARVLWNQARKGGV